MVLDRQLKHLLFVPPNNFLCTDVPGKLEDETEHGPLEKDRVTTVSIVDRDHDSGTGPLVGRYQGIDGFREDQWLVSQAHDDSLASSFDRLESEFQGRTESTGGVGVYYESEAGAGFAFQRVRLIDDDDYLVNARR